MKKIKHIGIFEPPTNPDVDSDIPKASREKVFEHCQKEYGKDNVSHIITRHPYKPRNAFKAVARTYGLAAVRQNEIAKNLPDSTDSTPLSFVLSDKSYHSFLATLSEEELEILKKAEQLEERTESVGVHACGVLLSSKPIHSCVPVIMKYDKEHDTQIPVSSWEYPECESLGLIKMDFLGLATLDLMETTLKNIKERTGKDIDLKEIINGKLDDPKVFSLFSSGHTMGVFQFWKPGVRDLLVKVKPTEFEELANITAIYRPGPMGLGLHEDYAKRKVDESQRIPFSKEFFDTPIADVTKNTLHSIIYQEQVMLIAQKACGFTPKEADKLRKAMGKKKIDVLKSMEGKFKGGLLRNYLNVTKETVNSFWDSLLAFASYAFNKSHAISYALNSYLCAWLKVYYPVEFMSALLQWKVDEGTKATDPISAYVDDIRRMGIILSTPSVNESLLYMTPAKEENRIIFGLSAIKGVSGDFLKLVITERTKGGLYTSLNDFIKRTGISESVLVKLANVGCFDCFNLSRKGIATNAASLVKKAQKVTTSLFAFAGVDDFAKKEETVPEEDYPFSTKVCLEGEGLNMYVSGSPLKNLAPDQLPFSKIGGEQTQYITFTGVEKKKSKKGHSTIYVIADNGTSTQDFYLTKEIVDAINLYDVLKKKDVAGDRELAYKKLHVEDNNREYYDKLNPIPMLKTHQVYQVHLYYNSYRDKVGIDQIQPVFVSTRDKPLLRVKINQQGLEAFKNNPELKKEFIRDIYLQGKLSNDRRDILFINGDKQKELHDVYLSQRWTDYFSEVR